MKFDYYYSREAEQFTFYRIPKALFTDSSFHGLSEEAKVLYGLMLDRMSLSLRSGWIDAQGRVYIYFIHADIQTHLGCGHSKATQLLRELDSGIGLIRRKRQGAWKPGYYLRHGLRDRHPDFRKSAVRTHLRSPEYRKPAVRTAVCAPEF